MDLSQCCCCIVDTARAIVFTVVSIETLSWEYASPSTSSITGFNFLLQRAFGLLRTAKVAFDKDSPDEVHTSIGVQVLILFKEISDREQAQFLRLKARFEPSRSVKSSIIEMLLINLPKTSIK
jgi:hypothetical protein